MKDVCSVPPNRDVDWKATHNGKTITVVARTAVVAKEKAMLHFHCEPFELALEMVKEEP